MLYHTHNTLLPDGIAWLRQKGVKKTTKLHCKQRPPRDCGESDREFCVSCAPLSMVVQVALREADGTTILTLEERKLLAMDLMEMNHACEQRWHDVFDKYGDAVPSFTAFTEKAGTAMRSFYQRHNLASFLDDMKMMVQQREMEQYVKMSHAVDMAMAAQHGGLSAPMMMGGNGYSLGGGGAAAPTLGGGGQGGVGGFVHADRGMCV